MFPNLKHFELLREKINRKLEKLAEDNKISQEIANRQINDYPWLYGALGKTPSEVMFICENPSIRGVENANVDTIDGGPPYIEAQWWGGKNNYAAVRFRQALYELELKITKPNERGGWNCYIMNVIKQANYAKKQNILKLTERLAQARYWADILQWEINQIKPKFIFCVGGESFWLVKKLLEEYWLTVNRPEIHKVMHYSARGKHEHVIESIINGVNEFLK